MNDLTLNITDLKSKIEKLVNLHQVLKKENEQLAADKENLQKTIDEQKLTLENMYAFARAGANIIISYHTREMFEKGWL